VRILFVTSRFPERHGKGDQSRAFSFIRHVASRHTVSVLSVGAPSSHEAAQALSDCCDVSIVRCGSLGRLLSGIAGALCGQPAQVGWMMPRKGWRAARVHAHAFDVVVANTVRSIRGSLPAPIVIDHIDALSWNMATRATGPEGLAVRLFARFEARRLRRWEQRVASWAAAAVVTTSGAARALPDGGSTIVIPVPWDGELPEIRHDGRDIDVIFTGDMQYPPNREGATLLAHAILPRVRREKPDAQLWIVGRSASRLRLPGIVTRSDVADIAPYLRRAKVAVSPVRGQGSLYKVLEAAANGAAIVAFPWAVEPYGMEAETAEDAPAFADAVIRLLTDESRRSRRAEEARLAARAHSIHILGRQFEAVLEEAAATR
jgi:polysaccharide biosynthesis protein PslH